MNIPKVNISFRKLKADVVSSSERTACSLSTIRFARMHLQRILFQNASSFLPLLFPISAFV